MKRLTLLMLALGLVAALVALPATAGGGGTKAWRVTIENLTAGQPLSPPLLVVHSANGSDRAARACLCSQHASDTSRSRSRPVSSSPG